MIHYKKIRKQYFNDIMYGEKKFEIRLNDCDYKVGDYVELIEVDEISNERTQYSLLVYITYTLKDIPQYGLNKDCILFGFDRVIYYESNVPKALFKESEKYLQVSEY